MPRALAQPPRKAPDAFVTVRSLARDRGCTVYRVWQAIALGELRIRKIDGGIYVRASSAAKWQPESPAAASAA